MLFVAWRAPCVLCYGWLPTAFVEAGSTTDHKDAKRHGMPKSSYIAIEVSSCSSEREGRMNTKTLLETRVQQVILATG
ncbi:hypothetical protein BD311DRAFT_743886 [Dichomitus squalens]|uniref:Secreted protein n=1 Tax=Dichomitus squalens TaxID=114155 RepID=A0A4Q9N818_9APHY|nr:hypothetical protein BD311DRAFT_743886 [Dichomitus squalens]